MLYPNTNTSDDMKKLPIIIALIIALIIGFCGGWLGGSRSSPEPNDSIVRDTIIDTIPYRLPVPVDSLVLRTEIVKLPVYDTIPPKDVDSIRVDSVYVEIPIQQIEYADSAYHAWVSGYKVNLDSINIYPKTIIETHRIRDPPKRWGLGVQVGAGYCGDKALRPYIGIGISYNILTW